MKRILAIIGIILLVAMYVITLIMAIVDRSSMHSWFMASLFCTAVIPILIWCILRFYQWINKKDDKQ